MATLLQATTSGFSGSLKLSDVRTQATRVYTFIAWLHVPVAALVALNAHNSWLGPALVLAAVAALVTICARTMRETSLLRSLVAAALTIAPIVFVYAGRGAMSGLGANGDWQIDYHMYFFAVFAMLVGYIDWRPIAVAAAVTAVHHLLLDLIVPAAVFPQEGLDRVMLHALCVVAECGVLIWITHTLQALFRSHEMMDFTTQATAEAIAVELAEKQALQAELNALRARA